MTSKGLVTVGPRQAAVKPDTMDCHAASCLPSPSCLLHSTPGMVRKRVSSDCRKGDSQVGATDSVFLGDT